MILIGEIIQFVKNSGVRFVFKGAEDGAVGSYCPLSAPKSGCITWVRHAEDVDVGALNQAGGVFLVAELGAEISGAQFPILYAENVHRTFFRILARFFADEDPENRKPGIAATAIIESENIGDDVYIGHHTYISRDVVIGDHVQILNNVSIAGKVTIGDHTVIESGVCIGTCGYGHYTDEEGRSVCVPHLGGVRIGAHVKIGANCVIARGCLADTVIEDYAKIDALSHIAHNVHVESRAMIVNSLVSGSATVGENTWLAPGTVVRNKVTIGRDSFLGLGTIATKDVPPGKLAIGVPARVLRDR